MPLALIPRLLHGELDDGSLLPLLDPDWMNSDPERRDAFDRALHAEARRVRRLQYGDVVYLRALIELTNYCGRDCYYCGLRASNRRIHRYRLDEDEVLGSAARAHAAGLRTLVLQGGEDPQWHDARVTRLVHELRRRYPDTAITLSLGERSRRAYADFLAAGADRYLLREETADPQYYLRLHPRPQTLETRLDALRELKCLGYQVGAGFMVGSPGQGPAQLLADLRFIQRLQPAMIGVGPFLSQRDTPFAGQPAGDLRLTLRLLAILRLMHPAALLPATTALATLSAAGRIAGLNAGANVLMPNFTPLPVRADYRLYDNKSVADREDQDVELLRPQVEAAGCQIDFGRGDWQASRLAATS